MTVPLNSSLLSESQSGTARLADCSRFLVANLPRHVGILDFDGVVHLEPAGRHIDLAAVDVDVAVGDHLAGGGAGVGKTELIHHVVQAGFENLQHLLAGDAAALQRLFIHAAELALHQPVIIAQFLLFDQTQAVIGGLAAGFGAVNAGAIIAAFQVFRRAEDRA